MGRTRKTIVAISAGLVSVLIMAGVAAASRGSDDSGRPVRAEDSTSTPSSGVKTTIGTAVSTTPNSVDDNGNDTSGTTPNSIDDNGGNTSNITPNSFDDHGGNSGRDGGDDDNGNHTSTSFGGDTSTTLGPIAAGERSYSVAGGTVVVNVHANRTLTLVRVTPNAGVEVDKAEASSDEIRVEFEGPNGDSRVRVRFNDGQLRVETRND